MDQARPKLGETLELVKLTQKKCNGKLLLKTYGTFGSYLLFGRWAVESGGWTAGRIRLFMDRRGSGRRKVATATAVVRERVPLPECDADS